MKEAVYLLRMRNGKIELIKYPLPAINIFSHNPTKQITTPRGFRKKQK